MHCFQIMPHQIILNFSVILDVGKTTDLTNKIYLTLQPSTRLIFYIVYYLFIYLFNSHCMQFNCYYYYCHHHHYYKYAISYSQFAAICQIRRDILSHAQDIDKMAELRDIKNMGIPSEISCLTDVTGDSEGIFVVV
jgi:hypothetical protein